MGRKKHSRVVVDNIVDFCKTKEEAMLGKVRKAALLAAMLGAGFGVMNTAVGGEVNLGNQEHVVNNGGTAYVSVSANPTFVYSGSSNSGGTDDGNIMVYDGSSIYFGVKNYNTSTGAKEISEYKVDYALTGTNGMLQLGQNNSDGNMVIFAAGDDASIGTSVTIDELRVLRDSEILIEESTDTTSSARNILTTKKLTGAGGTTNAAGSLDVNSKSLFVVKSDVATTTSLGIDGGNEFDINLYGGGEVNFNGSNNGSGMRLVNGTIEGEGTITGNVELSTSSATINVATQDRVVANFTQTYNDSVTNRAGNIIVNGDTTNGNANMLVKKDLNIAGGVNVVKGGTNYNAGLKVEETLKVTQSAMNDDGEITDVGFYIGGMTGHKGTVTAGNLEMRRDTTNNLKSNIYVDNNGILITDNTDSVNKNGDNLDYGTIQVVTGGTATFKNAMTLQASNELLNEGGSMTFGKAVTMTGAGNTIKAEGDGQTTFTSTVTTGIAGNNTIEADGTTVKFNDTLTMGNDSDKLWVHSGGTINYLDVTDGMNITKGQLVVGATDDDADTQNIVYVNSKGLTVGDDGVISFDGDGVLNILEGANGAKGDLIVNRSEGVDFNDHNAGIVADQYIIKTGVTGDIFDPAGFDGDNDTFVTAESLLVEKGANVNGSEYVKTTINGASSILGTYNLEGEMNYFYDDITVSAGGNLGVIATDDTPPTMTLAKDKELLVSGSTLGTVGGTLVINSTEDGLNKITFNGNGTGTNTVYGKQITATDSNIFVKKSVDISTTTNNAGGGGLIGNRYIQTGGQAYSSNNQGVVVATNTDTFSTISGTGTEFSVAGKSLDGQFWGGLQVTSGAVLNGTNNSITGNTYNPDPEKEDVALYIGAGSMIDLTKGSLISTGFQDVTIDGQILVGLNSTDYVPNTLTVDNEANFLASDIQSKVQFTDNFIQEYYKNHGDKDLDDHWVIVGGVINDGDGSTDKGEFTVSNVFGDYEFVYNDSEKDHNGAYISFYDKRDVYDKNQVGDYLGNIYGDQYINSGTAGALSGMAQNILSGGKEGLGYVEGSAAGLSNWSIFDAIARGNPDVVTTSDMHLSAGATLAGPIYVAQDSIRNIQDALHSRLDAYRAVKECVINECYSASHAQCYASGTALGQLNLDYAPERYMNRLWAGGLGSWQDADKRKGFDGYKYKSAGGIIGYDRAFGAAVVGASIAYLDGDYTDKAFRRNDSKIRQHNANLYGTYSASNGFFATVMGGYNYTRNKLSYGNTLYNYREKYDTHTWYASGKLGFDFMPCDNISFTPSVGVNYFHSRSGGHKIRSTDGGFNMQVERAKSHNIELPVQLAVAYEIPLGDKGGLTLMADGGYSYNFRDKGVTGQIRFQDLTMTGSDGSTSKLGSSGISGRKLGHHSWNAGAGMKFRYDHWDIGVKYDYYGRNKYHAHQVTGTVGYSF